MWDRITLLCLAIWALMFGILAVTNIEVVWGRQLMGLAALILGIVCLVRFIVGLRTQP